MQFSSGVVAVVITSSGAGWFSAVLSEDLNVMIRPVGEDEFGILLGCPMKCGGFGGGCV